MRFAYIDSNGNEVPIPSVDALALRIELGAISEETQLYDAQADQWGPAHTHEIFHSLSRSSGDESGFVAPPPMAPPPVSAGSRTDETLEAETSPDEAAGDETLEATDDEVVAETDDVDSAFGLTLADAKPPADEAAAGAPDDLDLTLAEPSAGIGGPDEASIGGLDTLGGGEAPKGESPAGDMTSGGAGAFDFGDMEGPLEVEGSFDDDGGADASVPDGASALGGAQPLDLGGGMNLETSSAFGGGLDAGEGPSLDLEAPMSEFNAEAPPSWLDKDAGADSDGAVMDFSAVGADGAEDAEEVPLRDRRTPRNKPSPPKLRSRRNLAGPIIGIVALLAVGLGGWVAWPVLSARLAGGGGPEEPAVTIPEIPEGLEQGMRALAEGTFAVIYADIRREWAASNPIQAPPQEWLAGIYLANASDFDAVEEFWDGMADYLSAVRAVDLATFDQTYAAQAAARGISAGDAALMRERADSGFAAAAGARAQTYVRVQTLIDAAVRLHRFLVANEARIDYVPASTVTTDPVLEADAPPEIRSAMEDLIDSVTRALGALGYREQVTADGLWGTVLADIQQIGVR